MFNPDSQVSWVVLYLLVGLAAAICHISSRRHLYFAPAMLLAPLPAFLFVHFMAPTSADAIVASDAQPFGSFFVLLTCYLPPALGVAAAYVIQRPDASLKSAHKDGKRRRHSQRRPNLSKPKGPPHG